MALMTKAKRAYLEANEEVRWAKEQIGMLIAASTDCFVRLSYFKGGQQVEHNRPTSMFQMGGPVVFKKKNLMTVDILLIGKTPCEYLTDGNGRPAVPPDMTLNADGASFANPASVHLCAMVDEFVTRGWAIKNDQPRWAKRQHRSDVPVALYFTKTFYDG